MEALVAVVFAALGVPFLRGGLVAVNLEYLDYLQAEEAHD